MPPQNIDAEQSVLGAMLLNPEAVGTAIEILRENAADVFYSEKHQHIYGAMVSLYRNDTPIDGVTLVEQLTRDGQLEPVGGPSYIADLVGAVPTSANVEYYARIVLDAAVLRRVISACTRLAGEAYSLPSDVNQLLDQAEQAIFSISETRQLNPIFKVVDLIPEAIDRIEAIIKSHTGYTGLPSGFHRLDELLSGFQKSDMIILAARPSVGKTAFALNIASNAAIREKKSVLVFSLEMSKEQLVQRLLCMEGQIDSKRLRTGFLAKSEFPKLQLAAGKLNAAPIYIDDTPNISILELRSKARRHAAQHGVDLLIIDYLQLMRAPGRTESRQTEIAEISRSVKGIARELRVPVIALSQLSREAEKDDTGAPKLSHLRESGAIEQDADVVLMLSRPPAYKRGGGDDEEEQPAHENLIHVNIAKQRNGPTGKLDLMFDRNIQRFKDPAQTGEAPSYAPPPSAVGAPFDSEEAYEEDDTPF
ncbi:MAG: replicative DNA helicase [Candidatus Hydrogenedentes bacterium]|nr:replicative DNA helicase [Candidatus Hydrogenedentota bacterium]